MNAKEIAEMISALLDEVDGHGATDEDRVRWEFKQALRRLGPLRLGELGEWWFSVELAASRENPRRRIKITVSE